MEAKDLCSPSTATAAFSGVVASYLLIHNLLRKNVSSSPLNFEDKALRARFAPPSPPLSLSLTCP
jgi:hypothetical protein